MQIERPPFTPVRRFRRAASALLISIAAYLLYAIAAVPFIDSSDLGAGRPVLDSLAIWRSRSYETHFPPGSWERDRPKMLETNQGTLLFDQYRQSEDGSSLRLDRCTFVYNDPQSPAGGGRPLILRAHEGATLFFNPPLQIARLRFGRLSGGTLTGRVTISGEPTKPDANDAVHIVTRDIEIGDRRIWTPHEVEFRFGPHHGRGKNLSIYLAQENRQPREETRHSQMGQIELLELQRVEYFEFELTKQLFSAQPQTPPLASDSPATAQIFCDGPFRFDFQRLVASLEKQVVVKHRSPLGVEDQLDCELLELHMASADADTGPTASPEPEMLIAVGSPVVITAPSRDVVAQAQRITFDVPQQIVRMTDRKRLTILHEDYAINAPEVRYEFSKAGELGTLWAAGPGRLEGHFGPEQKEITANWEQEVRLDSYEGANAGAKVLRIKGAKDVGLAALGQVSADEIEVYLSEHPNPRDVKRKSIRVERLRALGSVHVDSPRLTAQLGTANLWFLQPRTSQSRDTANGPGEQAPAGQTSPLSTQGTASAGEGRYHLDAQQLNAEVQLGDEPLVTRLDVVGNVQLDELPPGKPNSVFVRADQFTLTEGASANPVAWLFGAPARGSIGSLQFVGHQIEIQQGRNEMQINGPGSLQAASSAELPPIDIAWARLMRFDGQSARFHEGVSVRGGRRTDDGQQSNFVAQGDYMVVTLDHPVSFQKTENNPKVDFAELAFQGQVTIDHELLDERRAPASMDRMQISDLRFERTSGNLVGNGPGWLVHRGKPMNDEQVGLGASTREGIDFLRIDFARSMTGNVQLDDSRRPSKVVFQQDVKCLFGSIPDWQSELVYRGRESLGEHDGRLTSDILQIVEMPSIATQERSLELQAEGNVKITGRSVTGSGQQLSYVRSKDQLILAGDGRDAARLSYQKHLNSEPIEGVFGKVYYYPKTRTHKGFDLKSLDAPLDNVNFRAGLPFRGRSR